MRPLLQTVKNSRAWLPLARLYQRSGLKARVYSRSWQPPVRTVSEGELFRRLGIGRRNGAVGRPFQPPVEVVSGPLPPEDFRFFSDLVASLGPRRAFEFGTNWGVSTACLARNSAAEIWTLDVCREMFGAEELDRDPELAMILPREHTGWHCRTDAEIAPRVRQIFADSMEFDLAAAGLEPMDLVLVDACHKYAFVERDTANAVRGLAPGGVVLWHDYYPDVSGWTDVFRFVNDFARAHPGVVHVEGTHFAVWRSTGGATRS